MAKEIERKFLVKDKYHEGDFDYNGCPYEMIKQGYFNQIKPCVRIRTCRLPDMTDRALITIKSKDTDQEDFEFEYEIPMSDAREMFSLYCGDRIVIKTRYFVNHDNFVWHVDFFHGYNHGLVLAEIELERAGQKVKIPNWVEKEVTGEPKYKNYNLALKNEKICKK